MLLRRGASRFLASATVGAIVLACGARSDIQIGDAGVAATADAAPRPACAAAATCPGFDDKCAPVTCENGLCVTGAKIACDDGDPCTTDRCEPTTGGCVFGPRSFDLDGDGYRGPVPGSVPGAPGSCGDDCDDANRSAFPGASEACDGADNDCNGVVDDRARYDVPVGGTEVQVSSGSLGLALPGGLTNDGTSFLAVYDGSLNGKTRIFATQLDSKGKVTSPETRITQVEADASDGVVAFTGDRFGLAWSDRRDNNYEVYFATFDRNGKKLAPGDVRLSSSDGFSINPSIVWTGAEFVVAWQDEESRFDDYRVVAQRLSLEGERRGARVTLSPTTAGSSAQSPVIAVGRPGLGVAWVSGESGSSRIVFAPFTYELTRLAQPIELTAPGAIGVSPRLVWNKNDYAAAWYDNTPKRNVWGTVVDGSGKSLVPAKVISDSPGEAREPWLMPLGDRLLVVYSDDRDNNSGYEIYTRILTRTLESTGPAQRITRASGHSTSAVGAFGPKGEVGVLFRDNRAGLPRVYFTHLECRAD